MLRTLSRLGWSLLAGSCRSVLVAPRVRLLVATASAVAVSFGLSVSPALGDLARPPGWKEAKPRPDEWQWTPQLEPDEGAIEAFRGARVGLLPLSNSSDIASHLIGPPKKRKNDKVLSRFDAEARRRLVGLLVDNKGKLIEGLFVPRALEDVAHEALSLELKALGADVLAPAAGQVAPLSLEATALSELAGGFDPDNRPEILLAGEIVDFYAEVMRRSKPVQVQVWKRKVWMPRFIFRSSISMEIHLVAFDVAQSRVIWEGAITQGHPGGETYPESWSDQGGMLSGKVWERILNEAVRRLLVSCFRENSGLQAALSAPLDQPVADVGARPEAAAGSPDPPVAEGVPQETAGEDSEESQEEDQVKLRTDAYIYLTSKSALAAAAAAGSTEKVRELIAAGAEVDEQDRFGRTALMWTAFEGKTESAQALLEAGADVNATTKRPAPVNWSDASFKAITNAPLHKQLTPLTLAAVRGHLETVSVLIDAGAQLNATTDSGWTALMSAASTGETDVVAALLRAGANPNLTNELFETALRVAQRLNKKGVVKLLEDPTAQTTATSGRAAETPLPAEAGRARSAAPPLPSRPPTVFKKVKFFEQQGEETKDRDAQLIIDPSRRVVVFADKKHSDRIFEILPWDRISTITYENAKHTRVKTAILVPWSLFFRGKKHWLTITYGPGDRGEPGGAVVVQLDKKNYQAILATLNGKTGIEVRRLRGEGEVQVIYPASPARAEPR